MILVLVEAYIYYYRPLNKSPAPSSMMQAHRHEVHWGLRGVGRQIYDPLILFSLAQIKQERGSTPQFIPCPWPSFLEYTGFGQIYKQLGFGARVHGLHNQARPEVEFFRLR